MTSNKNICANFKRREKDILREVLFHTYEVIDEKGMRIFNRRTGKWMLLKEKEFENIWEKLK